MDFGEFMRGGTAPVSGKAKISAPLNPTLPSRPKTRAVDNDMQDTNIDLKNNRVKNAPSDPYSEDMVVPERDFARINFNDWNDGNNNPRRAPSRGKKSNPTNNPKETALKDNPLMSGLSAYTQNMPTIVLNTNRKSHKGTTAPPRTSKETRNISQINDLRAAYGADIPIGKPTSPQAKQRVTKPLSLIDPASTKLAGDGLNRLNLEAKGNHQLQKRSNLETNSVASSAASSSKDFDILDRGKEINSARSTISSGSEVPNSPTRKSKKSGLLLKASFSSKHSDESNCEGVAVDQASSNSPIDDSNDTDQNRDRNTIDGPSPELVLIPVDEFLNDLTNSGNKKRNKSSAVSMSNRATANNSPAPIEYNSQPAQLPPNLISLSVSDYTIGGVETAAEDVFADLKDQDVPEEVPDSDVPDETTSSRYEYISEDRTPASSNSSSKKPRPVSEDSNRLHDSEDRNAEIVEVTDQAVEDDEISPRPQSRKLYLGTEKSVRDISTKVPRSAGARYGPYSPIKGGVDISTEPVKAGTPRAKKTQFKKLSSYNDLGDWVDDSTNEVRPPSRQSTAFPVHLSSEPGTVGNSPATHVQPTLMNKMEILTNDVPLDVAESPTSVRSRPAVTVNTEPRTVKRIGSLKVEEEKKSSINSTGSVGNSVTTNEPVPLYNVRPPSRQKVAAQHLFDENVANLHNNPSIESIALSSRRTNRQDASSSNRKPDSAISDFDNNVPPRLRTPNSLLLSSRGKTAAVYDHDYNNDGFADLDPSDNIAPFPITVSYGNEAHMKNNSSQVNSSKGVRRGSFDDYPTDRLKGSSGKIRKSNQNTPRSINEMTKEEQTSSVRPKSVTAIPGNSPHHRTVNENSKYENHPSTSLNYDPKQEENTLRSRSANNYAAHHRLYNPVYSTDVNHNNTNNPCNVPYLPIKPSKINPNQSSSQGARTRAWGDQPDPRNIPRAQNTFGLEADTGWTSPALLGNPFSSTTIHNDNFVIQDDDEMTILTEESGGYNMDNSLSLQSFNIETSLDEDFLKLFAPGR